MIQIIIGLILWLALPSFLAGRVKKKGDRKAIALVCKIIGGTIVLWGIITMITGWVHQIVE